MTVSSATPPRIVEVRLALSATAAQRLSEPRVRRLLESELEASAVLAPGVSGPLGDDVAYVWIDEPSPAQALIEVRVGERAVSRREIRVAGLEGDVAARLVAIAASEMVRAQMQPLPPPRKPPPPHRATPAEIEIASRPEPALFFTPAVSGAFLPAVTTGLAGPSLSVGFRYFGASEALFARWLTGAGNAGTARWLEVGLTADYRFWLHPSWRLVLGGAAAISSLHLGDAMSLAGVAGDHDTWSGRAGAVAGIEGRVGSAVWLGFSLEPGAVLRPVRYEAPGGSGTFQGLWLGANLTLQIERVQKPAIAMPPPSNN